MVLESRITLYLLLLLDAWNAADFRLCHVRGGAPEKCQPAHGCLGDAAGPVSVTAQHLRPGPMNGS